MGSKQSRQRVIVKKYICSCKPKCACPWQTAQTLSLESIWSGRRAQSFESDRLLTMAVPCATHGCPGQASRRCERPFGEQLCGNCCDCVGHGRRTQRGGPRAGGRAEERAEERQALQREYRVLNEACGWHGCSGPLMHSR